MTARKIESVEDIRSILLDPEWTVRPPDNVIPSGLRGTPAGDIFSSFARMSDGEDHKRRKQLAIDLIASRDLDAIPARTREVMRQLHPANPHDVQFLMPGMVVAALLGVSEGSRRSLVEQVRALVVGARPTASESDQAHAIRSIKSAIPAITATLDDADRPDLDVIASRVSLVFQSSDACAAMIGNALVMLSSNPNPATAKAASIARDSMQARVPVRSTSRFRADDSVVLDLEAAHNQYPAAGWTFGFGPHACPARSLAQAIAVACIDAVIAAPPFDLAAIRSTGWEDLPNVWIPKLTLEKE